MCVLSFKITLRGGGKNFRLTQKKSCKRKLCQSSINLGVSNTQLHLVNSSRLVLNFCVYGDFLDKTDFTQQFIKKKKFKSLGGKLTLKRFIYESFILSIAMA